MSPDRNDLSRLLRWYPHRWRERYGDELCVLMEDQLEGRRPNLAFRLSVGLAGMRERAHDAGIVGQSTASEEQARGGVLVVLGAWAMFVIAGAGYSKLSEHFARALPIPARALPTHAFDVIRVAAGVAGLLSLVGIGIAVLPLVRFLQAGGWNSIRRSVVVASIATIAALALGAAMIPWAHSLSSAQRNGADPSYSGAFGALVALVTATIALWAWAAIRCVRRLHLKRGAILAESALAVAVAAAMCTATIATAIWWGSIATRAPWFLHGTKAGTSGSPFELQIVVTMVLMVTSVLVGEYGLLRIGRSWVALARSRSA